MSSPNATSPAPGSACPRCGRAIPSASPLGACPHCLLAAGLPSLLGTPAPEGPPPPSPAELAPEFPALELLELLGRGGMGAVYKARQRDLDRLVALKILRPGLDTDPGFAGRFTREARALAQLNHPGIVTLYEFGRSTAGRYFILMEFVDGVNLRGLLDAGRLAPREALAIVPPLCDALQYAHDRGLVHRDIKPENILVDRLGRVKIADFGIARLVADTSAASASPPAAPAGLTAAGNIAGTPAYMAPEQRERPAEVDHRADLYSLGVVLYQMLTGELPAPGQLQPPSRRVGIDVRLDEIVLRALEKDPALRYAAARDFKTRLETVTTRAAPADAGPAHAPAPDSRPTDFEYKSRRTLFGLPWLHVVHGSDPATGRPPVARGVVAIGGQARGIFAFGGVTAGVFAFGGVSFGLFAFGGLGIALLASFSGLAVAPLALGGASVGWYALGGLGFGRFVLSGNRRDPAAVEFFDPWAGPLGLYLPWGVGVLTLLVLFLVLRHTPRRRGKPATGAGPGPVLARSPGGVLILLFAAFLGLLPVLMSRLPLRLDLRWGSGPAAAGPVWNLDVVVTDHRAWPPQTLPADRALPVAGAALALLGSCDNRESSTGENWRAAESAPHLRLEYPRAAEGGLPDVIIIPLPLTSATSLWTRKAGEITRHSAFSSDKAKELNRVLDAAAPPPPAPRHRFGEARSIDLPRSRPTAYDFDRERFFDYAPSPLHPKGIEASQDWHAEQGTDIFADPDSYRPGVLFLGTDLAEVVPEAWDSTADDAAGFSGKPDEGLMVFVPAPRRGQPRPTYVYRTPQGGMVLVQILGANDAADISLRYKTIIPIAIEPLRIGIANDGTLSNNGRPLGSTTLAVLLRRHVGADGRAAVVLTPSLETKATALESVLHACADAGAINVTVEPPTPPQSQSNSPPRKSHLDHPFDRAGDTMQTIVQRLRQEHGLRICFENLDFTPADAITLGARLQDLGAKETAGTLTAVEAELLRHARRLRDEEKLGLDTLVDVGSRHIGLVSGDSTEAFLQRLVEATPYSVRFLHDTWLIEPRAGSRLSFPVTLKTAGLTFDEAVRALLAQAPADQPISSGMMIAMPVAPGANPTPWLSAPAPALDFRSVSAAESLCQLTALARPACLWNLAGYRGGRMLSITTDNSPEARKADKSTPTLRASSSADALHRGPPPDASGWLQMIDRGDYAGSWRESGADFQAAISEQDWVKALLGARTPLGAIHARQMTGSETTTKLPGAPDGEHVVMTLSARFDHKAKAVETGTFSRQRDGTWRPTGYFIR